jgi:truncated hemoglobin YjbI
MIERLVRTFYGRARLDQLIGPIFDTRAQDDVPDDQITVCCAGLRVRAHA